MAAQLCGSADEWKSPIIIQVVPLRRPDSPRIRTGLYESDGGELKVQIDVLRLGSLRSADFDMEVYGRCFSNTPIGMCLPKRASPFISLQPGSSREYTRMPWRGRKGSRPESTSSLIKEESPPKLEAFLKERPEMLDATSRAIYRARCLGLLPRASSHARWRKTPRRVLLQSPSGQSGRWRQVAREVSRHSPSNPPLFRSCGRCLLRTPPHPNRVMPLSVGETQKRLSLILEITAPRDPRKPRIGLVTGPEGLQAVARTGSGRYVLRQKAEDLLAARGEGASAHASDRRRVSHDRQPTCRQTSKKS